jgi:hypothetical protein
MKKVNCAFVMALVIFGCNTALAAFDQEAGPIWDQQDAEKKCPTVCSKNGATWNGQWVTTVQNEMSVCGCERKPFTENAGPIWNQDDAQGKCPNVCKGKNAQWNGQWWTTVQGEMSVCECVSVGKCSIEAGPIWDQADADKKCPSTCEKQGGWNGQWWTTVQGAMSVCTCNACK